MSAHSATVGGGRWNVSAGPNTTVGGGFGNTASGDLAVVAGGGYNCAGGQGSFAAGVSAKVRPGSSFPATGTGCAGVAASGDADGDEGSFVWADEGGALTTTGPNQFIVRADGGVMFNTTSLGSSDDLVIGARATSGDADADLVLRTRTGKIFTTFVRDSDGAVVMIPGSASADTKFVLGAGAPQALRYLVTGTGAYLSTAGIWTDNSSRALKTDFAAVDTDALLGKVLELPISEWSYIVNRGPRHVGPVAEDFHASFGLGESDAHIASLDSVGVALAAIQGLNAKLESENATLRADLAALQAAVAELQAQR
jgi:hypothetical protein